MTTKEQTMRQLKDHPNAEMILSLAVRWRREQLRKDTIAEGAYRLSLACALDELVHDLTNEARETPKEG